MNYKYMLVNGTYYVPRPSGMYGGMKRKFLFHKNFGKFPVILTPQSWDELAKKHTVHVVRLD